MIEIKIAETLKRVGVPTSLLGNSYLRYAIKIALEDASLLRGITKVLYPDVAKHFGTNWLRVERAIRHAVEVAWDRGDAIFLNEIFGDTISAEKGKPTNKEFISAIVDWIDMELLTKTSSNIVPEWMSEGEADA